MLLQESIMDFYWHYVSKDTIDEAGKNSFLRAISIASQVFNSISEYIQVSTSPVRKKRVQKVVKTQKVMIVGILEKKKHTHKLTYV